MRKLRFGVMCNSLTLAQWQAEAIQKILTVPGTELALVIMPAAPPQKSSRAEKLRKIAAVKDTLWPFFLKAAPLEGTDTGRPVDASGLLSGAPHMRCEIYKKGKWSEYFTDADVQTIQLQNLDFILKFAFGIIRGEILTSARYGIWSYHHDDPERYRGAPPAFWEMMAGDPVSGAVLQRLTERLDGGVILQKCFVQTTFTSYRQNLAKVHAASTVMPAKVCIDLLSNVGDYVHAPPVKTDAPIYKAPKNTDMLRFLAKCTASWVKQQITGMLYVDSWNVGFVDAPIESFLDPGVKPHIRWLPDRRPKAFLADPFFHFGANGQEILAEEFDHTIKRGYISRVRLNGGTIETERVIDEGLHLSYPYVFEHAGSLYCIPECAAAREVALYRYDPVRRNWTKLSVLVQDFPALDATVIHHEGRWWMFTTSAEGPKDATLYIWYADELTGPWSPHVGNPVKTDVRSSRPAGTPFYHARELYRPAQDCAITYGDSIRINRVLHLSPDHYEEEPVVVIRPPADSPYQQGFHTLSAGDGMTVVDGRQDVLDAQLALRKLLYKLRKATGMLDSKGDLPPRQQNLQS